MLLYPAFALHTSPLSVQAYLYCCVRFNVFTESLPSDALAIHVTIRKVESFVQIGDWCVPWKIYSGAQNCNGIWSSSYSLGTDHTESVASNSYSIDVCYTVVT
jgi:hypothetical protein